MATLKVVPIHHIQSTRERIIKAVGAVLAREGFLALDPDKVAAEAGVDRALLFRYFHGLPKLMTAFSNTEAFWPTVDELLQGDPDELKKLTPGEQMALFFKRYMTALRKRPLTLEILAWEALERNDLATHLEEVRVRTALEFFEHLHGDIPDHLDLTPVVLLLAGAINFLAVRSRTNRYLGGVDLHSEMGWERIEGALDLLLKGALDNVMEKEPKE